MWNFALMFHSKDIGVVTLHSDKDLVHVDIGVVTLHSDKDLVHVDTGVVTLHSDKDLVHVAPPRLVAISIRNVSIVNSSTSQGRFKVASLDWI